MTEREQTSRLESLFDLAADLSPDDRAVFLDEQCGDDVELRRRLETLLGHDCDLSRDFLAPQSTSLLDSFSTFEPGQIIAEKYRLLQVLGEGGMGIVFLAEQDSPRRQVAVKVIRPGIVSRRSLRRFEHEAYLLGRLQHPGIAQIFEATAADTGVSVQPYLRHGIRARPVDPRSCGKTPARHARPGTRPDG